MPRPSPELDLLAAEVCLGVPGAVDFVLVQGAARTPCRGPYAEVDYEADDGRGHKVVTARPTQGVALAGLPRRPRPDDQVVYDGVEVLTVEEVRATSPSMVEMILSRGAPAR